MTTSLAFILISIIILAVLAGLAFFTRRKGTGKRITPLASLAFAFILAGLFFGENKFVGYGLMGIGVVLAVVDILKQSRTK